jgi:type IV secretion system protein VirB4
MFFEKKIEKEKITKREVSESHFIPYQCHWNHNTILTKKQELVRVIKIGGLPFETMDSEDLDFKKEIRNNAFRSIAQSGYSLYFHTIRRKEKAFPEGDMTDFFSKSLNTEWKKRHADENVYVNEHYITIIKGEERGVISKFANLIQKLHYKADRFSWEMHIRDMYEDLEETTSRILNGFSSYNSSILGLVETEDGVFSELLEFFARIVNANHSYKLSVPMVGIDHYLPMSRLYFGKKSIEIRHQNEIKYAGIISIKEYRNSTYPGMFDGFMQLPFELIISQSFEFVDRGQAISSMQLQQRRLIQAEDVATSQIGEIDQALDSAMSGDFAFGEHHFTVLCIADSLKILENYLSLASVELSNVGINAVREKINLEPAYWAQLPCNFDYAVRRSKVNTLNLASFASFHNYPSGKRSGNHWGDAVTVFDTSSGTPYFFNFHIRDVGHTMIIGPTGSGKTLLLTFLCAQARKFNCNLFFFDKDYGAKIFINAINGKNLEPTIAKNSGFNPFQLPDTSGNRAFLVEFLTVLATSYQNKLSPDDLDKINQSVNGNYNLDFKDRRLRNVIPFLGIGGPDSLVGKMSIWYGAGSHAKLFDNPEDLTNFQNGKIFGIEMSHILNDSKSLAPTLLYLFHLINNSLDGSPTMIVLDEAWALIDNPIFAPKIKNWLKVLRKFNAFVIFATQSVEDAAKSAISDTLIQQTSSQIFLPNLKATDVYKDVFMLSSREFNLVKSTDPSSRFFLLKQDNNGVIARINLAGMGDFINILSGRTETLSIFNNLIEKNGSDPKNWIEDFCKLSRDA